MFTTIFNLSAENRVDCSALWTDAIPNKMHFTSGPRFLKKWTLCNFKRSQSAQLKIESIYGGEGEGQGDWMEDTVYHNVMELVQSYIE